MKLNWALFFLCELGINTAVMANSCSRVINAPVAPLGSTVIVADNQFTGIYPDLFRQISQKEQCQFQFSLVPRARMELLFETGQADLLFPAIKTEKRDESGVFVPLIYARATLIVVNPALAAISDFSGILHNPRFRLAVVRGFDYGPEYRQLLEQVQKQNRLIYEADPISVARMLKAGAADGTIMTPYIFAGAVQNDSRINELSESIRYMPLAEIGWQDSGIYISKKSLSEADRNLLQDMMERLAKSGAVWKAYLQYYKADAVKAGSKPH